MIDIANFDYACNPRSPQPRRNHAPLPSLFPSTTTPQQWEDFSRYNHDRACAEITASQQLRETVFSTIERTANDLKSQDGATDYALRKRLHEMKMAVDELVWQKKLVSVYIYSVGGGGLTLIVGSYIHVCAYIYICVYTTDIDVCVIWLYRCVCDWGIDVCWCDVVVYICVIGGCIYI